MNLPKITTARKRTEKGIAQLTDPIQVEKRKQQKIKHDEERLRRACRYSILAAGANGEHEAFVTVSAFNKHIVDAIDAELTDEGYAVYHTDWTLTINWAE